MMSEGEDLGAKVRHGDGPTRQHFAAAYEGKPPPWDIGRPQRDLVRALDELQPRGLGIDLGCGTGEHVLEMARRGLEAWGLDSTAAAIDAAGRKARERALDVHLVEGDALDLRALRRRFDLVLDCGLFHVIADAERQRYVEELRNAVQPGGHHVMLGFSTNPHDRGPRGYSEAELREYFADGFELRSIRPATYEVTDRDEGQPALLSVFVRR